ncbi:MAG: SHOCT domain-containing protein [Brevundimonas sp.]|nr:SHOCT domain-containing protein [Brevundimonas sp.]
MEFILIAVVIGLIPAAIASNKGQNFFLWWLYGAALWIVAIIHAIVLKGPEQMQREAAFARGGSEAQELERFAKLKAEGHISEDEFAAKKRQLLGL